MAVGWVVKKIWTGRAIADAPVLPLLVFSWLVFSASSYFADLPGLPSSSADLRGPPTDGSDFNSFAVEMKEGKLIVGEGAGPSIYQVDMTRRGGLAGIPVALESVGESGRQIRVIDAREPLPPDLDISVRDSGWLRFGGWEVRLHSQPTWSLTLSAPEISADLQNIEITALTIGGKGNVRVGEPVGPVEVAVNGSFTIEVPVETPMEVTGAAIVPEDWRVEEDMAWIGERGAGWHLVVSDEGSAQIVTFTR